MWTQPNSNSPEEDSEESSPRIRIALLTPSRVMLTCRISLSGNVTARERDSTRLTNFSAASATPTTVRPLSFFSRERAPIPSNVATMFGRPQAIAVWSGRNAFPPGPQPRLADPRTLTARRTLTLLSPCKTFSTGGEESSEQLKDTGGINKHLGQPTGHLRHGFGLHCLYLQCLPRFHDFRGAEQPSQARAWPGRPSPWIGPQNCQNPSCSSGFPALASI